MSQVGRVAATDYNGMASRGIRRARDEMRLSQGDFARKLSDQMGLGSKARFKQSTISGWELGRRQVPAGALIAAADAAAITIAAALGRSGDGADTSDIAARVADLAEYVANSATPKVKSKDAKGERRAREAIAAIRSAIRR